jgi:hypothetical protein
MADAIYIYSGVPPFRGSVTRHTSPDGVCVSKRHLVYILFPDVQVTLIPFKPLNRPHSVWGRSASVCGLSVTALSLTVEGVIQLHHPSFTCYVS